MKSVTSLQTPPPPLRIFIQPRYEVEHMQVDVKLEGGEDGEEE